MSVVSFFLSFFGKMLETHLANLLLNIHKPSLNHLILPRRRRINRLSKLGSALDDILHPELRVGRVVQSVVIGHELCAHSLHLKVAARDEVLVGLAEESELVGDAAFEFAGVDEVKGTSVEPV